MVVKWWPALICTMISENQGREKLRSVSNLRKISGNAHMDFFSVCHLDFFQVYGINLAFFSWRHRKKIQVSRTWNFSKDWSRPWFSEIKVQIKRPHVYFFGGWVYTTLGKVWLRCDYYSTVECYKDIWQWLYFLVSTNKDCI
jgi:hypothetical protein